MLYTELKAGNEEYKLRLNTRNIVTLEKTIGCNPMMIFGNGDTIPTVTQMISVLHASLQQYQHNLKFEDACEIFDTYLADGHTVTDFIYEILEVYRVSGIISNDEGADNEKN